MTVSAYHQAGVQNDWVIIWQTRDPAGVQFARDGKAATLALIRRIADRERRPCTRQVIVRRSTYNSCPSGLPRGIRDW